MVWAQYVYEANVGTEVDTTATRGVSDDEGDDEYTVHAFYEEYLDDLRYLYDMFRAILHEDMFLEETTSDFGDFVDLCFYYVDDDGEYPTHPDVKRYANILRRLRSYDASRLLANVTLASFVMFASDRRSWEEKYLGQT